MMFFKIWRAIFALMLACSIGLASAEGTQDEVERFKCNDPSASEKEFYDELIYGMGRSVLVSRGDTWFSDVELCLFSWYVSDKFSLAGYTWITHHALLRMMSTDPEQFFDVVKKRKPAGYRIWSTYLDHAELWGYGKCPNPSPLQQAARSITGFKFKDAEMEDLRLDVLGRLRHLKCEVPE
ncbi:MAG TPA: hypothetical protein VFK88_10470 [Gallionella sp.]|nr:hypothetical protein [Gallionella sp.]